MKRCLLTLVVVLPLTAGRLAASDTETVMLDFSNGKGRPKLLKQEGTKLDAATPLSKEPHLVFRLAPQDHVVLDVIGQNKDFTGKILAHKANFVKKEKDGGFLGLFPSEERKNHPDKSWSQLPKKLDVGIHKNDIQVILEVRYRDGSKDQFRWEPPDKKIDVFLRRPATVYVFLKVPDDLVAWEDGGRPNAAEEQELHGHMEERKRANRFDDAQMLDKQVQKGHVGKVTVKLVAVRGT